MRQYRGLTKDGEWVYGWYVEIENRSYIKYSKPDFIQCTREVIPETVGQQVGLKDKNGKEIYEGDIVRYLCVDPFEQDEVRFIGGYYVLCGGVLGAGDMHNKCLLVIGNIHQNPELMEKDEQSQKTD